MFCCLKKIVFVFLSMDKMKMLLGVTVLATAVIDPPQWMRSTFANKQSMQQALQWANQRTTMLFSCTMPVLTFKDCVLH